MIERQFLQPSDMWARVETPGHVRRVIRFYSYRSSKEPEKLHTSKGGTLYVFALP